MSSVSTTSDRPPVEEQDAGPDRVGGEGDRSGVVALPAAFYEWLRRREVRTDDEGRRIYRL